MLQWYLDSFRLFFSFKTMKVLSKVKNGNGVVCCCERNPQTLSKGWAIAQNKTRHSQKQSRRTFWRYQTILLREQCLQNEWLNSPERNNTKIVSLLNSSFSAFNWTLARTASNSGSKEELRKGKREGRKSNGFWVLLSNLFRIARIYALGLSNVNKMYSHHKTWWQQLNQWANNNTNMWTMTTKPNQGEVVPLQLIVEPRKSVPVDPL